MIPLMTASLADVPNEQMGNASGVNNLARSIGGSMGISLTTALVVRGTQTHSALLVGHLSPYRPEFQQYLQSATEMLSQYSDPATAQPQAYGMLYGAMQQQANLFAYVDTFRLLAFLCLLCVPVVFCSRRRNHTAAPSPCTKLVRPTNTTTAWSLEAARLTSPSRRATMGRQKHPRILTLPRRNHVLDGCFCGRWAREPKVELSRPQIDNVRIFTTDARANK